MQSRVKVNIGTEKYNTEVIIGKHTLAIDEPESLGGKNLGPTPMDLFLSSIGTCKAITMRMYADMKEWPLEKIEISLSLDIIKNNSDQFSQIEIEINLIGNITDEQKDRILKVADKCPIHKMLNNPFQMATKLKQ